MSTRKTGYVVAALTLGLPSLILLSYAVFKKSDILTWIFGMVFIFSVFTVALGIMYIMQIRKPEVALTEIQTRILTTVGDAAILITLSYGLDDLLGIRLNILIGLVVSIFMYAIMHVTSLGIAAMITAIDFALCKRELKNGGK